FFSGALLHSPNTVLAFTTFGTTVLRISDFLFRVFRTFAIGCFAREPSPMPLKTHQDDMPAVNLTPMIDIVFQLIIFFMVGARFTELEKKVDLSVPEVG